MAKALKEEPKVKWFKSTAVLGDIRLLPSNIHPRVLIRYIDKRPDRGYGNVGQCNYFGAVCILKKTKRDVFNGGHYGAQTNDITKGVVTPKILFQYDFNSLDRKSNINVGMMFRPDEKRETLSEMMQHPLAFHFPHIYETSYMCLTNRNHISPRQINNFFWTSQFNYGWGGMGGSKTKKAYEGYIASKNSNRDKCHKDLMSRYINFFEIDKKPDAVFFSTNKKVLEKASDSVVPNKNLAVGFAWHVKGSWYVYFKGNLFIRFSPEQVHVG